MDSSLTNHVHLKYKAKGVGGIILAWLAPQCVADCLFILEQGIRPARQCRTTECMHNIVYMAMAGGPARHWLRLQARQAGMPSDYTDMVGSLNNLE